VYKRVCGDINAITDTEPTLNIIIKKIKTQDADLQKLHLLLQTRDRGAEKGIGGTRKAISRGNLECTKPH
jgi:hypothetical protein